MGFSKGSFLKMAFVFKGKKNKNERIMPRHIAIIMDGNGRWAKKRALPRSAGHSAGSKNFKDIARYCNKIGLEYLTVYAFSTENWKRPANEVENIMNILRDYLKDAKNFRDENIRVKFIGKIEVLPEDIIALIKDAEENSANATGLRLNIALNYGGRDEILSAVKNISKEVVDGNLKIEEIDEDTVGNFLYTAGQPDPDFIIRPSGEYRLSNYLIWQSAYSEFWFSNILWPDFKPKHLEMAIDDYSKRNRRFGGV